MVVVVVGTRALAALAIDPQAYARPAYINITLMEPTSLHRCSTMVMVKRQS